MQAFEEYCRNTTARHGLFSFEDCATVDMLGRQLNAAVACATDHAVLILYEVIPSAPPQQMFGQLRDDRWTFKTLLEQSGAEVHVIDVGPGGMLVAIGMLPMDIAAAKAMADRLHEMLGADDNVRTRLDLSSPAAAMAAAERAFDRQIVQSNVELFVDVTEPGVLSTEIEPFRGWIRPLPAFVADLSSTGIDTSKLYQNERSMHGVTIDEFWAATLIGRDFILTGPADGQRRAVYGKNKTEAAMVLGLQAASHETAWDAATRMISRNGKFYYPKQFLKSAETLVTPGFLGTPDEFLNFGMWLLHSVPGIRHYQKLKDRYPTFLAATPAGWQRRMLLDLGVAEGELVQLNPERLYRAASVATMRQTYRSLSFPPSDMEAFDEVAERAVSSGEPTPEKIFVSRMAKTQMGGHRGLLNEPELAAALVDLGYTVVEPEKMPILHQARVFRNARSIVGLGGAAMFNTGFCRAGTRLVDIENGMSYIDSHINLFASRGLEFGLIVGEIDATDPSPHQKRWSINVPRAIQHIRSFI